MKNLIIAPHVDDEVLGCGGVLDDSFHVVFCGMQNHHIVPAAKRYDELRDVADFLGFSWAVLDVDEVNDYRCNNYIVHFEETINDHQPNKVYVPYPSYNQDHQQIYKAAMVALRPHDKNYFVDKVLVYEETDCLWGCPPYHVTYFVPINIDKKIYAYNLHASQIREHRDPKYIKAQAKLRGAQIGVPYAEGFIVNRWVD